MSNENIKLKPITFKKGEFSFNRQNVFQQNLLLKALQVTTDPKKLRDMAGLKSIAEVYRTLDKLAIRKEYHEALAKHGVDLEYLVQGIKSVCDDKMTKPGEKLKGLQLFLKSLGLDEYKEVEGSQAGWEDALIKAIESGKEKNEEKDSKVIEVYDVKVPKIPEEEKRAIEKETKIGKSIYE